MKRGPENIRQYVAQCVGMVVKKHYNDMETQVQQIHRAVEMARPVDSKGLYSKTKRKVVLYFCVMCLDPCVESRLKMCCDCSYQVCKDCPEYNTTLSKCSSCPSLLCQSCNKSKCEICNRVLCKRCQKMVACSYCENCSVLVCDSHQQNAMCYTCCNPTDHQGLGEFVYE